MGGQFESRHSVGLLPNKLTLPNTNVGAIFCQWACSSTRGRYEDSWVEVAWQEEHTVSDRACWLWLVLCQPYRVVSCFSAQWATVSFNIWLLESMYASLWSFHNTSNGWCALATWPRRFPFGWWVVCMTFNLRVNGSKPVLAPCALPQWQWDQRIQVCDICWEKSRLRRQTCLGQNALLPNMVRPLEKALMAHRCFWLMIGLKIVY